MAHLTADISLDGLLLNGRLIRTPMSPSEYADALKSPVRVVEPSPPAPYGHRNNQIHLFDECGLYLIEHHASRLVDAVVFVLWLDESAFKTAHEYSGELLIGGLRLFPGMEAKEFAGGNIAFEGPVLGLWKAERDGVWIGIEGKRIRQRSGRRGKRMRIANVSCCFTADK